MSIENIRALNSKLKIYTTSDKEFAEYGVVIQNINTDEIVKTAEKIEFPKSGSMYVPSLDAFEALNIAKEITDLCFGTLDTQIGYCYGKSNYLNALEWHTSSEINVAVTDLILLLAKRSELKDNKLDSSCVKAFYIKKGEMIEVFATSLHFCPCQVEEDGFGCVVALPKGTNVPLDGTSPDPYLFRKNKWIIAHNDNKVLIDKGVVAGISGENYEIKY